MGAPHPGPAVPPQVDTPVRGEACFRFLERPLLWLESACGRWLPAEYNPVTQSGAIAVHALIVALVSGVLLLFWYTPSVHGARDSVLAMTGLAGFLRALHRYSSDACVAFTALHALRLTTARRFTGARWLAWVTGIVLVGMLWVVGWLGYWLLWDERARQVALGTARFIDALPIVADPLSRSFLTDDALNTLLFFVVFFVHMLLPLAMAIALWLHVARVARSRFLPDRPMSIIVLVAMSVISILVPADLAAGAKMAVLPGDMAIDGWYLLPLWLTDRLPAAALWGAALGVGALVLPLPWLLGRGRARVARVEPGRCDGCTSCAKDCPYDAIKMVDRPEGGKQLAQIDTSACVGCGVCAGSCNSAGIGLDWFPVLQARHQVDEWLAGARSAPVLLACAESAARRLTVNPTTGTAPELPGWKVLVVPCAGWVHAYTVERAAKHGAASVTVMSCGPEACRYREGATWAEARMGGTREPSVRPDKTGVPVRLLEAPPGARVDLAALPPRRKPWLGAAVVSIVAGALVLAGSVLPYASPRPAEPELVVAFKHSGAKGGCRKLSEAEKAALPPHMRRDEVCDRGRAPVRLRVTVDGAVTHEAPYAPRGLWGDGNSIAIVTLPLAVGPHVVTVALGETTDPGEWSYVRTENVEAKDGERVVISHVKGVGG